MSKDEPISELRQIMLKIQEASKDYIAKLRISEPLLADLKPFLSAMKNELATISNEGKRPSEAQIDREATGNSVYRQRLMQACAARLDTIEAERRYDNLCKWLELARSEMALTRETIKHGIFSEGG